MKSASFSLCHTFSHGPRSPRWCPCWGHEFQQLGLCESKNKHTFEIEIMFLVGELELLTCPHHFYAVAEASMLISGLATSVLDSSPRVRQKCEFAAGSTLKNNPKPNILDRKKTPRLGIPTFRNTSKGCSKASKLAELGEGPQPPTVGSLSQWGCPEKLPTILNTVTTLW